jgi:hypothetical protein
MTTDPAPVHPAEAPSATATQTHRPTADIASVIAGMPRWLDDFLLAAGLLAASAFAAEPVVVLAKRRRHRSVRSTK